MLISNDKGNCSDYKVCVSVMSNQGMNFICSDVNRRINNIWLISHG